MSNEMSPEAAKARIMSETFAAAMAEQIEMNATLRVNIMQMQQEIQRLSDALRERDAEDNDEKESDAAS